MTVRSLIGDAVRQILGGDAGNCHEVAFGATNLRKGKHKFLTKQRLFIIFFESAKKSVHVLSFVSDAKIILLIHWYAN